MAEPPKTLSAGSLEAEANLCRFLQKKQLILYAQTRIGKRRHHTVNLVLFVAENNSPPTLTQIPPSERSNQNENNQNCQF